MNNGTRQHGLTFDNFKYLALIQNSHQHSDPERTKDNYLVKLVELLTTLTSTYIYIYCKWKDVLHNFMDF